MTNIDLYPLQDNYESKLSQPYDGVSSVIYVDSIPTATLPWWAKVLFTINPWTSFAQTVEVDGWSTGQLNVSSTTVEKGNGINYSTTSHGAKSPIIISDNFAYWKEIATNVNSKADIASPTFTGSVGLPEYVDATARDTAIPTPTGKELVIVNGDIQHYNSTTLQRETADVGTPTPNASTTVAGKVEKATQWEANAWTSTGWTGAELFVWPAELKVITDWITVPDASETVKWAVELATVAETITGTDTVRAVTPAWVAWALAGFYDYTTTIQWYTEASVIWTSANTGLTITATDIFLSNMMKIQPTGASGYAYNKLYTPKPTTTLANSLNWTNISIIELEFQALLPQQTAGQSAMIGIGTAATDYTNVATTTDSLVLAHTGNTNDVFLKSADGTTASNSSTATSTQAGFRKYKIVYTKGVNAILYIDWVSVITKTTNLPDSWDIFIWAGKQETGAMYISPITVRIKYT